MQRKTKLIIVLVLLFITAFVWQKIITGKLFHSLLEVSFLDVGEGDSILIEIPPDTQILIDGGPSGKVVNDIYSELPFLDREIELVILTHPDQDHITGLFEVIRTFEVKKVVVPQMQGDSPNKDIYKAFKGLIKQKDIKLTQVHKKQLISIPSNIKSSLLILWPPRNFNSEDTNDFSIVSKFSYGNTDFLLTGDILKNIEYQLLTSYSKKNLESEVLKIAHHGSKSSTSKFFLQEVSPQVATISVGENNYGHPAEEVLERLQKNDILYYRTDNQGKIKIFSNGKSFRINTAK